MAAAGVSAFRQESRRARPRPSDRVRIRSSLRSACRFVRACGRARLVSAKSLTRFRPSTQAAAGSTPKLARLRAWMRASVGSTLTLGLFLICAREEGPRKGRSVPKSTVYALARKNAHTRAQNAYRRILCINPHTVTVEGIKSTLYALARTNAHTHARARELF